MSEEASLAYMQYLIGGLSESLCQLTNMFQPAHLPDSLGELNERHVVAVVNIFQQLVDLLFQLYNPCLHCENITAVVVHASRQIVQSGSILQNMIEQ